MADKSVRVEVRGLKELNAALKQVADMEKGLQPTFKAIATDIAGRVSGIVPRLTGTAAGSVRPRATQRGAKIVAGGGKAEPYYPWLEFHGIGAPGRYLYPTIADSRDDIGRMVDEGIERVVRAAGFDTSGSAD